MLVLPELLEPELLPEPELLLLKPELPPELELPLDPEPASGEPGWPLDPGLPELPLDPALPDEPDAEPLLVPESVGVEGPRLVDEHPAKVEMRAERTSVDRICTGTFATGQKKLQFVPPDRRSRQLLERSTKVMHNCLTTRANGSKGDGANDAVR
jgi:hypothetical protein